MFFFLHLNNTVSSENKMLAHVHKYYAVFKSSGSEVIFPNYLRSMFILICGQLEFVYIHIQLFLNWYRCWPHLFSLFFICWTFLLEIVSLCSCSFLLELSCRTYSLSIPAVFWCLILEFCVCIFSWITETHFDHEHGLCLLQSAE